MDSVYVRDTMLKGKDDVSVMEHAKQERRILVTTETGISEKSFPICTHSGIIIFTVRSRHEAIRGRVFSRFLRSGFRKYAMDSVTYLRQHEALVKTHLGQANYRF